MPLKSPSKKGAISTVGLPNPAQLEKNRVGLTSEAIKTGILENLYFHQARFPEVATRNDYYLALSFTIRDRLLHRWLQAAQTYFKKASRTVCYLSAEFLLGPHLGNNLVNLGVYEQTHQAVAELGLNLDDLLEQEEEPGLGNGGLGRLAACYMDSLATLEIPSIGYGIRYEFGIFDQLIRDGWQVEITDKWLQFGNPWEIPRPEIAFDVKLGGYTESCYDENGKYCVKWIPNRVIKGIAYDTPLLGYRVNTATLLRLWKAEACESFDFQSFNVGDYYGAVEEKVTSENISKVLYPNDEPAAGKQLRLEQQYFFVSCSLQDMVRIYRQRDKDLSRFHLKYAIQLNDTHPSIAIPELMRILVDECGFGWEQAWEITCKTFAYTNHTLLPEALEKWPVGLMARVLPRHLEIIFEINHRFLNLVRAQFPGDDALISRISIIDESGERYVRMAHLASVGSHSINGVAKLHSELLKQDVLKDFFQLYPDKFCNVTNGVTPRRFLVLCNPNLARLISSRIGDGWVNKLDELRKLEAFAEHPEFRDQWRKVKLENKRTLAEIIALRTGIVVNPLSLFDIQAKRLHEYKRQLLNVLHVISLYLELKRGQGNGTPPRTVIFGAKAAPGYFMAKLIIKLINSVGDIVNRDPEIQDRLKVVFFPDFNVKNAQWIYPAADLSEQISTAGKEASGTGNMKFAMNGALTIGTLDGANVEIREETGADQFFLFGLNAQEVAEIKRNGYHAREFYEGNPILREVLDLIRSGYFSPDDVHRFEPIVDSLLYGDDYLLLADFASYLECQKQVGQTYLDPETWARKSILTVARMGKFSSDRSIKDYCDLIWKVQPVHIDLENE